MVKKRKTQINIYIMLEKSVNNKKDEKNRLRILEKNKTK